MVDWEIVKKFERDMVLFTQVSRKRLLNIMNYLSSEYFLTLPRKTFIKEVQWWKTFALIGHETVDSLSIIITKKDVEQTLHVPVLDSGAGKAQAYFDVLCGWGLEEIVKAYCFDIAGINTGYDNGPYVIFGWHLNRKLWYLIWEYHILEIILKAVSNIKIREHQASLFHY